MGFENKLAGGNTISDLEFIRKKMLAGDWITVTGNINALNNEIAYTPATGKTFFVHSAKIVISTHTNAPSLTSSTPQNSNNSDRVKAELQVDGVVKDTTNIGIVLGIDSQFNGAGGAMHAAGAGAGTIGDGRFNCIGLFLAGNSIKKVRIINTLAAGSAIATLVGWIENT